MRQYLTPSRGQIAYFIPTVLYTLWQACVGWLNHYWTFIHLGREQAALLYISFFLAHAFGIAAFAWWLDSMPDVKKIKQIALASSILTGVLTAAMALIPGNLLFSTIMLSGLVSGFFMAYLSYFLWLEVPENKRGITIGAAAALGVTLHFIAFVILFPEQEGNILYAKTIFAALVALSLGVSALYLPACRDYLWPTRLRTRNIDTPPGSLKPGVMFPLLLILGGFFLSYGMQDYSATVFWLGGEDYLAYTRIFLIVGFVGGGMMCDLQGNHTVLNTSFSLLAMGFVSMAFEYRGAYSFIGFSCVQMASAVFSVGSRIVFIHIAGFYKKPVLICSLGLVLPLILKQFGIITAEILYKTSGNMSIFIVSLLAIIGALPLVSLLFEKLRDRFMAGARMQANVIDLAAALDSSLELPDTCQENSEVSEVRNQSSLDSNSSKDLAAQPPRPANWTDTAREFAQKYAFNPRETQVLELTLHGLSVAEMAHTLSIAEPTVKQYIRQMLRKTETKNRRQLLSMLIKEQGTN